MSANLAARRVERAVAAVTILVPGIGTVIALRTAPTALDLCLFGGFYLTTQLGITAGFHRLFAHRSFETTPRWKAVLIALGSMAGQGPLIFWVAAHRRHHQFSDRPGDPHSPLLGGLFHAHVGWMLRHEPPADWSRAVRDLLEDDQIFRWNGHYVAFVLAGLAAPAALGGLVSWSWQGAVSGFLWGGLVRAFSAHHVTWAVNSLCHRFGARPNVTRDDSRNVLALSLFTLGESWHNNHHALPTSARHGFTTWQLDPTYGFIRVLERFGAAWDVKLPNTREKAA
jgi:stearoyl-CoA desaturase (delta-9 desaturase)